MRTWGLPFIVSLVVVALTATPQTTQAAPDPVVVQIRTDRLEPRVVQATTAQRVVFVNRTGRIVHVQFQGKEGARHHVYQVPGEIWAVVHYAGPHLYVVHFETDPKRELRGVVEVGHAPESESGLPTCRSVTVRGDCLDP